jgi:hypothetical protein
VATYILIDNAGSIVQQVNVPTATQLRTHIVIGVVNHFDLLQIGSVQQLGIAAYNDDIQQIEFQKQFGPLRTSGNVLGVNATNLLGLDKTEGTSFLLGSNRDIDPLLPNTSTDPLIQIVGGATLIYKYRDGAGGFITQPATTSVAPDLYDDGTGTLATLGNNRYQIQPVFYRPREATTLFIYYGTEEHTSLSEARANLLTQDIFEDPDISDNTIFLGWVVIKKGTTDLNDAADAFIQGAGLFRGLPSGSNSLATNLSYDAGTRTIISDTGTDAVLPLVVPLGPAGLINGIDKDKLDNIQSGAQVNDPNTVTQTNVSTADNLLVKTDGTGRIIQESGITITDGDEISGDNIFEETAQVASFTLTGSMASKHIDLNSVTDATLTFPQQSTEALDSGYYVSVTNKNIGVWTIAVEGADTLDGVDIVKQNETALIKLDAAGSPQNITVIGAHITVLDNLMRFVDTVADQNYTVILEALQPGKITSIITQSDSGTCTLTGKINGVALGGTANSVSPLTTTQTHTTSNTFNIGDKLLFTISANVACLGMSVQFNIEYD